MSSESSQSDISSSSSLNSSSSSSLNSSSSSSIDDNWLSKQDLIDQIEARDEFIQKISENQGVQGDPENPYEYVCLWEYDNNSTQRRTFRIVEINENRAYWLAANPFYNTDANTSYEGWKMLVRTYLVNNGYTAICKLSQSDYNEWVILRCLTEDNSDDTKEMVVDVKVSLTDISGNIDIDNLSHVEITNGIDGLREGM